MLLLNWANVVCERASSGAGSRVLQWVWPVCDELGRLGMHSMSGGAAPAPTW